MKEVAELARKLAEEAVKTGKVKLGMVMLQDVDGIMHKTEFGFDQDVKNTYVQHEIKEPVIEPPKAQPKDNDIIDVNLENE